MNIKWIQYFTKKNEGRRRKKFVRRQYSDVKYQIRQAVKTGNFYAFYHSFLYEENVKKLRHKGFKVEKNIINGNYNENWKISWEI